MTEKVKKTLEDTALSPEAKSKPCLHSKFEDRMSGNRRPDYSEPSMAIDNESRALVLNSGQPSCFRELGTEEKYEHETPFLHPFLV